MKSEAPLGFILQVESDMLVVVYIWPVCWIDKQGDGVLNHHVPLIGHHPRSSEAHIATMPILNFLFSKIPSDYNLAV